MKDFENDMEQLAAEIALAASSQAVSLADRIDAFKALMPYYALLRKSKKLIDEDEADTPTFANFQAKMHAVK